MTDLILGQLPFSIQELCMKFLVHGTGLQTSKLCSNSMKMFEKNSMQTHCECSCCVVAGKILCHQGDLIKITYETMSDDDFHELLTIEQAKVHENFEALPDTPLKHYLNGEIQQVRGNLHAAANAYLQAFFGGVVHALFQYGKVLTKASQIAKDESVRKTDNFEACIAFLLTMVYNPFSKLYLARLLLSYEISLRSIDSEHKEATDCAIQTWLRENEKKIATRLQDLMDKQTKALSLP